MTFNLHQIGLTGVWLLQAGVAFGAQAVIATFFGTSPSLDAYLVGTSLPMTVNMIVSTGLGVAGIVYFNQVKAREGESAAHQSFSGLLIAVVGGGSILSVVFLLGADQLVAAVAPGLSGETRLRAVSCLQLTSLSLPFLMAFSVLSGLLQAQGQFYLTSLASILLVGLVPLPVLLGRQVSPQALAWGFNLGACGSCIVLALGAWRRHPRAVRFAWPDWKRALSISLPASLAAAFTYALWLSERYYASSLDPGTISALNYGLRLVNFVAGGLTFATSTILLPYLSAWVESGQKAHAASFNRSIINRMTVYTLAGVIFLLAGGEWLVRLAFARGEFDESAVALTTTAVRLYIGMFIAYAYGMVLSRNMLAMNEGKLIVTASAVLLFSYLALTPVLVKAFGFEGLPLSASIAFMLSLAVSLIGMWRKHPEFYWRPANQKLAVVAHQPRGNS